LQGLNEFNVKTGKVAAITEQTVKTPSSSIKGSKVIFDEVGIYEFNGKKFAVNLLDEAESDVIKGSALKEESESAEALKEEGRQTNLSLSPLLLILVFLLLCFEIFYIKRRGDL
jgi:hypothetical protein